jgi:hypothetical protein
MLGMPVENHAVQPDNEPTSAGGYIKMVRACLSLLFLILFISSGFACSFDTDCQVASRCVKASGQIYGICAGGLSPGNRNDNQPVYAPLDLDRSYGNTCSFDLDCGISNKCFKSSGSITRVCVSGR